MSTKEEYKALCNRIAKNGEKYKVLLNTDDKESNRVKMRIAMLHSQFNPKLLANAQGVESEEAFYFMLIRQLNQWFDEEGWERIPFSKKSKNTLQRRTNPIYPIDNSSEE